MTLAYIRNKEENDFLKHFVVDFLRLGAVWNKSRRVFQWEDGSPLTYTNWVGISTCPEEYYNNDCSSSPSLCTIEMDASGSWNIYGCKSEAQGLCQRIEGGESTVIPPSTTPRVTMATTSRTPSTTTTTAESTTSNSSYSPFVVINIRLSALKEEVQGKFKNVNESINTLSEKVDKLSEKLENQTNQSENQIATFHDYLQKVHQRNLLLDENINRTNESIESVKDFGTKLISGHNKSIADIEMLKRLISGMKESMDELRNRSNYLTLDESKIMSLIYKLQDEEGGIKQKVGGNEDSVKSLSKKLIIFSVILTLSVLAFLINIGYKNYYSKRQFSYKNHNSCSVEL